MGDTGASLAKFSHNLHCREGGYHQKLSHSFLQGGGTLARRISISFIPISYPNQIGMYAYDPTPNAMLAMRYNL
jgi:hypothetical protein